MYTINHRTTLDTSNLRESFSKLLSDVLSDPGQIGMTAPLSGLGLEPIIRFHQRFDAGGRITPDPVCICDKTSLHIPRGVFGSLKPKDILLDNDP